MIPKARSLYFHDKFKVHHTESSQNIIIKYSYIVIVKYNSYVIKFVPIHNLVQNRSCSAEASSLLHSD